METYDKEMAQRVWERVRAAQPEQPRMEDLQTLIAEEWYDAAVYLQLSRQFKGKYSETLRRMFEQEQSHAACLKGIYTLTTGTRPDIRSASPKPEPVEVVLRRCYGREMRSLARYEARADDPEYGQIYARLAAQERAHCHTVLELLGSLKK